MDHFAFVSSFYYLLLFGWVFGSFPQNPLSHFLMGVLVLALVLHLLSFYFFHWQWLKHLWVLLQFFLLLPILLYGKNPEIALFFSIFPALSIGMLYGRRWGGIAFLPYFFSAFFNLWLNHEFFQFWPHLLAATLFSSFMFWAINPLLESVQKATQQFAVLEGLGKLFDQRQDQQVLLQWLVENAVIQSGAGFGAVYLWNEKLGKLELQAFFGSRFEKNKEMILELTMGTLEWVVKEGKPYVVNDLSLDPRYAYHKEAHTIVSSLACLPLGRSKVEGIFVCGSTISLYSPAERIELLSFFAQYMSLVLEQEKARQTLQRLSQELGAFHAVCSALTSSLDLEEFLHLVAGFTQRVLDVQEWTLFLFDSKKKEFYVHLSTTPFLEEIVGLRLFWGEGAVSQAVIRKAPLAIPDLSKNPLVSEKENRNGRFLSMLVIPLLKGEEIIGAIQVSDTVVRTFSEEEIRFVLSLASLITLQLSQWKMSSISQPTQKE
jgi:GAF domain-containing protein